MTLMEGLLGHAETLSGEDCLGCGIRAAPASADWGMAIDTDLRAGGLRWARIRTSR